MLTSILRRRVAAVITAGTAAVAVLAMAVPAGASTGARQTSPEQAGYTATGAQFKAISTHVYLRNPAQYADYVASYRYSVQLWSSDLVITLGVRASTSGGSSTPYVPYVTIYDRSTHQVIASNPNAEWCALSCHPGIKPFHSGYTFALRLFYSPLDGIVGMSAMSASFGSYGDSYTFAAEYPVTPPLSFTQARVGTEFGSSPWDASYSHPQRPVIPVKIAAYSDVRLTSYSGHTATLWSWWVHHKLLAFKSASDFVAAPNNLKNGGADFQTFLE